MGDGENRGCGFWELFNAVGHGLIGFVGIGVVTWSAIGAVAAVDSGMEGGADAGDEKADAADVAGDSGGDGLGDTGVRDGGVQPDVGFEDPRISGTPGDTTQRLDGGVDDWGIDDGGGETAMNRGDRRSDGTDSVENHSTDESTQEKGAKSKKGSPKVDPESIKQQTEPVRPWVLTVSAPHLILGAISSSSGRYWPMLELTFEMQQAPKLSVAPVAGGMLVTTDIGTSGVLTGGAQGRAYMTDTFNTGLYGAGEILVTGAIGGGSADPTLGAPFVYSGVSPSLMLGMKLNPGKGLTLDSQIGVGIRYLLADQLSIFDVNVEPQLDLTVNVNLGWGFPRKQ